MRVVTLSHPSSLSIASSSVGSMDPCPELSKRVNTSLISARCAAASIAIALLLRLSSSLNRVHMGWGSGFGLGSGGGYASKGN